MIRSYFTYQYEKKPTTTNESVKNASSAARRMEFQRSRIPRQAHRDTVLRFDREGARPAISRAGDMDLPASQLNIVFARVLHHRLANFLFRARAVSRLDRFILNEVLELIVREVRWDEFETDGNHY